MQTQFNLCGSYKTMCKVRYQQPVRCNESFGYMGTRELAPLECLKLITPTTD